MATHHGKEGQVKVAGTACGELTGFTIETTIVLQNANTGGVYTWIAGVGVSYAPVRTSATMLLQPNTSKTYRFTFIGIDNYLITVV